MRRIVMYLGVVLAACAPAWATGSLQTCQIGLCNPTILCGGCVPCPMPVPCWCPCPNPCLPPVGGCQVNSSLVVVSNSQMTGPCGNVVGLETHLVVSSQVGGGLPFPSVLVQYLASIGVNGNTVINIHIP